jgi:signal transduction histidine kinase
MTVPPEWPNPSDPWLFVADQPAFVVLSYAPAPSLVTYAAGESEVISDTMVFFGSTGPEVQAMPFTAAISGPPSVVGDSILQGLNRNLLLAAVSGGGVALVLTAVMSRGILGPVESLTAAARRMEKGDRTQRVEVRSNDEIGALAHAFNAMADSVSQSEQLRRQMVNDVAHELRTPLTNIRGYLEAVRDGVLEPKAEVINSLHEESMLLNRLVADLQELALAEAGQLKLTPQPVALVDVAERAANSVQGHLDDGPAVVVQVPADLPLVLADPERLGQVLRNLLENASQHTPSDGTISIVAQALPEAVEVSVSDTGSGIAPEHLPHVFERFYRADASRARATGGAGLGLAIVRQLVEAHGGKIWVNSQEGAGTTFAFTLPYDHSPSDL